MNRLFKAYTNETLNQYITRKRIQKTASLLIHERNATINEIALNYGFNIEIHFFEFKELDPKENYGQVYIRTNNVDGLYKSMLANKTEIHPNGALQTQAWGQKEFALLDPDNNLLTFAQSI